MKKANKNISTYLASGWFNKKQKDTMNKVRDILLSYSEIKLFAPFYDGIVLTKENDSPEKRAEVFSVDIGRVVYSNLVVVCIDDFEPGTIFEMGGAGLMCWIIDQGYELVRFDKYTELESIYSTPRIIAYSDVSGRGLNVMLQQAVWGFANGEDQLREQVSRFINNADPVDFLSFEKGDFV